VSPLSKAGTSFTPRGWLWGEAEGEVAVELSAAAVEAPRQSGGTRVGTAGAVRPGEGLCLRECLSLCLTACV